MISTKEIILTIGLNYKINIKDLSLILNSSYKNIF